jgi:transposase
MKEIILVVGIDISMDDFYVCIKEKMPDGKVRIKGTSKFSNSHNGFIELISWVTKRNKECVNVLYVMEATGSYYEDLAYFLYEKGNQVSVVLANKIKHFAKSLNVKTKTDKVDSTIIAEIGVERELPRWIPMAPEYRQLRDLCREMLSFKKDRVRAKCQLHAMDHSHEKTDTIVSIKKEQIDFYEESIQRIELEIKKIVRGNEELKRKVEQIEMVKGLGLTTIVTVLCETNGFLMFNNLRQVVSYAGLDIELKESGKYKGKTKISKKGNARIRQCLYMPAMSATQYNKNIKDLYERINERNPDIKRKGIVAGMRKLLILIFVLWKKDEKYDPNYVWQL